MTETRLSKNIKTARKILGMNQTKFAEAVKVHQTMVSHLETGRRRPTERVIQAVAELCQVAPVMLEAGAYDKTLGDWVIPDADPAATQEPRKNRVLKIVRA